MVNSTSLRDEKESAMVTNVLNPLIDFKDRLSSIVKLPVFFAAANPSKLESWLFLDIVIQPAVASA